MVAAAIVVVVVVLAAEGVVVVLSRWSWHRRCCHSADADVPFACLLLLL